jgi:hypothetical protein
MSKRTKPNDTHSQKTDKFEQVVPPGREPVHQGQQFDEMQRQHKNPDSTPRDEDES